MMRRGMMLTDHVAWASRRINSLSLTSKPKSLYNESTNMLVSVSKVMSLNVRPVISGCSS